MDLYTDPPPGLARPKTSPPPPHASFPRSPLPLPLDVASPTPQRATTAASWASSLAAGLFPATFPSFPVPPQVPHGLLPSNAAVQPAVGLHNGQITDLGTGLQAPALSDPWHRAHARVCAHAVTPCAACSIALFCCSCRALRFTPGPPPASPPTPTNVLPRSFSASPAIFRNDVGNGSPPPEFGSHNDQYDDNAYVQALADSDTCDNSSCPRGVDKPATYTITVEQFDEGAEEHYNRTFRACSACNRSCKKSFLGFKIKSRVFDNSVRTAALARQPSSGPAQTPSRKEHPEAIPVTTNACRSAPLGHATDAVPHSAFSPSISQGASLDVVTSLQGALHILSARPPTPAAFVATVRVKHDAACSHPVASCSECSLGLVCCSCHRLFAPAVACHLACTNCQHVASTCCTSAFCCSCNKPWLHTDAVAPVRVPARRFYGGAGSADTSSPEPDIWTPSPRSSPDEIDDLTARAALPLPASRSESDASRAPSRASSVDEPVNVAATPLPTPDYSSLLTETIDGFVHASFPERAILDDKDKRHFLGRGDLSVTSLKLYARRIFTETSHWITAGHFLVDIFQGSTLNGSRDDFRRFVILVGTQLGFGDLAQSMSESLDTNRKMADEYMRLRDVATTWKQKAKTNSKDAKDGRKARDELSKARGDITAILEERDIFIHQRQELLKRDDELSTELSRVHRDYSNAIDDNIKFAADIESLKQRLAEANDQLQSTKNILSMTEHHRDKAERDCGTAILRFDKEVADRKRDKTFYEARITALTSMPIPTSQPDTEAPLSAAAIDRSVLTTRLENMKKELSAHDAELAKLRSEVSLSDDVNTLRAELAEAKAVAARLSGMYEQKSKDFRESELERLTLLGKQILADGEAPKDTPPARPRPASRRGRQRSRSASRDRTEPPRLLHRMNRRLHPLNRFGRTSPFSPNTSLQSPPPPCRLFHTYPLRLLLPQRLRQFDRLALLLL